MALVRMVITHSSASTESLHPLSAFLEKVPHLQTGTLNTFPQPNNELWEFSNPKFHRDHPDWLAGITRKKSAKELAAAAALAAQEQTIGQADGSTGIETSAATDESGLINGQSKSSTDLNRDAVSQVGKEGPDSQSLSKAITLMKDTHSSLERELAELKASNEMLWRQAMLSREEQLKSQKKLDSVMRFLAGQFGTMNMSLLEDENDNLPSTSTAQPARITRVGNGRMIGDGVNGLDGNVSDEDMDEDAALWETGDHEEARQFWEVDDNGKMIKVSKPRGTYRTGTNHSNTAHPWHYCISRKTECDDEAHLTENSHTLTFHVQHCTLATCGPQIGFLPLEKV
jgi:hypothetical protein